MSNYAEKMIAGVAIAVVLLTLDYAVRWLIRYLEQGGGWPLRP